MKTHPGQLMIDFRIPAKDPLTVSEVAQALWTSQRLTNSDVLALIDEGKFGSFDISMDDADRNEYRIPLTNFIHYLDGKYGDALYFKFPEENKLTINQVADSLGACHQTVRNHLSRGEFPNAYNIGTKQKEWRIPIVDLVAFVNRRRVGYYC